MSTVLRYEVKCWFNLLGVCLEAIGEAKVEWMTSSDIQASDEEVFNYTTVLPIKGKLS
jgi:hypothetical protein